MNRAINLSPQWSRLVLEELDPRRPYSGAIEESDLITCPVGERQKRVDKTLCFLNNKPAHNFGGLIDE